MPYSRFNNVSPLDFRYYVPKEKLTELLDPYVTEAGRVRSEAMVEAAVVRVLADRGVCTDAVADEVAEAAQNISPEAVAEEEARIHHNIRALVNVLRGDVSDEAKPYIHLSLTSFDVIDTAQAWRFKNAAYSGILPLLSNLQKTLINLARREAGQIQMGRTHGQHAVPITFGFAIVGHVSRVDRRMRAIKNAADELRGKISGAVGAYNASHIFFDDPEEFENAICEQIGLKPSRTSTQIVEPESYVDYFNALVSTFGVLADLADDMRHLQRTEIAEVGEEFEAEQVGSSTMPHKRNPWNFENVKSMWKAFMPRMDTIYADQLSEHQRDLSNSASSRFNPEIIAGLANSINRLNRVMGKLVCDEERMEENFEMTSGMVAAEPAYILLAAHGYPDAHEAMRKLTLKAQSTGRDLWDLMNEDEEISEYLDRFTENQRQMLKDPRHYTGIAEEKTLKVCDECEESLQQLLSELD